MEIKKQQRPQLDTAGAFTIRAGDGIRTHDNLLGKQVRYHCVTPATELDYSRIQGYVK